MKRTLRIAVADDEQEMLDHLVWLVGELGHEPVVAASTGLALFDGCRSTPVDLVITDILMPEMTGLEALERLADDQILPAIIVSAYHDPKLLEQATSTSVFGYLVKPIKQADLEAAIAIAMRRFDDAQFLREQSFTDDLTGLYNRRAFFHLAEQHVQLAARQGRALLVGMADVDGLKEINDRFGHSAGDDAIRASASILRATFRGSDILARIGGDEFAILATVAPDERIEEIEQRFRTNLGSRSRQPYDQACPLSLSLGMIVGSGSRSPRVADLLAEADKILYVRKQQQREVGQATGTQ